MTERQEPRGARVRVDHGEMSGPRCEWEAVPGFLPRWEIPCVVAPSMEFYLEEHGTHGGVELFKVFRRRRHMGRDAGVAVSLSVEGEFVPLRAQMLPIDDGDPPVAALIIEPGQRAALARIRGQMLQRGQIEGHQGASVASSAPRGGGRR